MNIRDLNGDNSELTIFKQNDGDIQVTIIQNSRSYRECIILGVRVGSAGSGHSIPPKIFRLLRELAEEFEKYNDCKNEAEAYKKWSKENKQ